MSQQIPNRGVLLASGGLDSTTLAYWMVDQGIQVLPIFLDYGQHCRAIEHDRARKCLPQELASRLEVVALGDVYRQCPSRMIREADLWIDDVNPDDLYMPYRNLLFLTAGAAIAQSRAIPAVYAAFINSNHAKEIDCSTRFFDMVGEMMKEIGSVRIELPFRTMSKLEVARIGLSLGAPIAETYSCQVSASVPCGACPNCVERLAALDELVNGRDGDALYAHNGSKSPG